MFDPGRNARGGPGPARGGSDTRNGGATGARLSVPPPVTAAGEPASLPRPWFRPSRAARFRGR
jgi:hypothetical protein